ncbi:MAG: TIGR03067 domain-containing protein, partial [Planctomycetales bacterium]
MRFLSASLFAVVLFSFVTTVGAQDAQENQDAKKDQDALQGTWRGVEFVASGKPVPKEAAERITFVFEGNKMTLSGTDGPQKRTFSFTLDPSKNPKAIDVSPLEGAFKGKTSSAI